MPEEEDEIKEKFPELLLTPELIEKSAEEVERKTESAKLEDVFGTEEATAKCLVELVKPEKINILTNITHEERQALVVAEAFGNFLLEKIGSDLMLQFTQVFKELAVSIDGERARQIVSLGGFMGHVAEERRGRLPGLLGGMLR